MKTARSAALKIYTDIEEKNLYANLEVPKQLALSSFSASDKARITDLVHGSFRWQLTLLTSVEIASKRSIEEIDVNLRRLLVLASYELLFGKTAKEILVSEWVNEAKKNISEKTAGFVNAVLRRISERDLNTWQTEILKRYPNRLDLVWSHPKWIIEEYRKLIHDENELTTLLAKNNDPPILWSVDYNQKLSNNALSPSAKLATADDLKKITSKQESNVKIQDAASQAAAFLLAKYRITENETDWLDACAAPGGKTAMLANVAPTKDFHITAVDIHPHKEQLIKKNVANFRNVEIIIGDSRLSPWKNKKFDRILIDAPCTGLGAIRRRSESRWKKTPADMKNLTNNAKEILDAAVKSSKNDAFIEYVVCSPILEETDYFVDWALQNYPELHLIPPAEYLPLFGEKISEEVVSVTNYGLRFWPHLHETDAMFVSLFQVKRSN